ncbi:MAG: class I SAM-dependent methyltransferase [Pseudomarimonas sp.]
MITPELPFTGERFTPECVREIWLEHWHRYAFALPLARGKRVLDAACGEGYGSALLATVAGSVLGLDISQQTIAHAQARYGQSAALTFRCADVAALDAYADASFDLIASFETLEHLHAQEAMLDGFARLLAPGGVLLISTPDRHTYSDLTGFQNEHHVRELYRHEFEALLNARFSQRRLYAQKLLFQGVLWRLDDAESERQGVTPAASVGWGAATATTLDALGQVSSGLGYAPLYYLAACAKRAEDLHALTDLHLFGDAEESVYRHYEAEIRKGIAAGHRLIELERELEIERSAREQLRKQLADLQAPRPHGAD